MGFTDLFKPKYKHSDWKVRKDAVRKITDEKLLIQIVNNDPSPDVREVAVEQINNQRALKEITNTNELYIVRVRAFTKIENREEYLKTISDEYLLYEIANYDKDQNIRSQAVKKISEVKYLKDIVIVTTFGSKNLNTRIEAVKKITDLDVLKEIINNNRTSNLVIHEAAKNITDENTLYFIVSKTKFNLDTRLSAIEKIRDEKLLRKIISSYDQNLCPHCQGNERLNSNTGLITAHNVPYRKYVNNPNWFCGDCQKYIEPNQLIKDKPEIYEKTAERMKELGYKIPDYYENRYDYLEKMTDQEKLEFIMNNFNDKKLCQIVKNKITDKEVLVKVKRFEKKIKKNKK